MQQNVSDTMYCDSNTRPHKMEDCNVQPCDEGLTGNSTWFNLEHFVVYLWVIWLDLGSFQNGAGLGRRQARGP